MKLVDIKSSLKCEVASSFDFDPGIDIQFAYASDLMSDILVAVKPGALLLTGLTNNQVIRTSKVAATSAIVFVRGKKPKAETIKLANHYRIPILTSKISMFDACGILFTHGVKGVRTDY
jgi:predicted transcriptional regulator